ncbi:PKD domain-containing protein [Mariniflexile litorale]|uniref:PKD domain-containing protein n=1 Tax=Mariniflexile litorale TaxID=3045158 RepID=A0AAU7ECV8_9FLAO|nr:PKD domain-containing protein [Mariniflexile sp. KMM 9835]MDQ8212905.1 PKD domain-containing protein [Mariniflexile sp. KMM 9835]
MKNKLKIITTFHRSISMSLMVLTLFLMSSCDPSLSGLEYDLPETNSKADENPPEANFLISVTKNYLAYTFANSSTSSTDYIWDYGDGNTSTGVDGSNTFPGEGTYVVTLTATDKLGVSSTKSVEVIVVMPPVSDKLLPIIQEPGFDLGDANGAPDGDSRLAWTAPSTMDKIGTNNPLIAITSTNLSEPWAAKIDVDSDRFGYQELSEMSPNTDYVLTFWYRFNDKTADQTDGSLRVSMIKPITLYSELATNTVASITINGSADNEKTWTKGTLEFNSGTTTTLVIFFDNEVEEIALDNFDLAIK